MRLEEGRILGDYIIVKYISNGPLGDIYVGQHRFTKKKVFLKVLPEDLSTDRYFLQRFEEEAEKIAFLNHPLLAKIEGVCSAEGLYFLVTECVVDSLQEMKTLRQHMTGRRASSQEALFVAEQLAAVLDYLHEQSDGLCHGNLKPDSILIRRSDSLGPEITLTDACLYKMVGQNVLLLRSYKAYLEQCGMSDALISYKGVDSVDAKKLKELSFSLAQNISFLSPEQKQISPEIRAESDVYAFGVLLFWMLTGMYPEGSWEEVEGLQNTLIHWTFLIKSCLSLHADKRPKSLTALIEEAKDYGKSDVKATPKVATISVSSSVGEVRQEKIITEYFPERKDPKGIVPLLSDVAIIDEGYYNRGSDQGCRDENPRHSIRLRRFAIDIHPVTNEQFVRFLDFLGSEKEYGNHDIIRLRDSRIKRSAGRFTIERGYAKHPVVGVTWYGATSYAAWIGRRLPTEAEWEIACCGGLENPTYPMGENIEKSQANFFSSDTTAVMSYPPNGYGLYDVVGNVYEWCSDWYEYNYFEYSAQEPEFPKGPIQGVYRVLRGGCWRSLKEDLRCSKRHRNNPGVANATYGFRCAHDVL